MVISAVVGAVVEIVVTVSVGAELVTVVTVMVGELVPVAVVGCVCDSCGCAM